MYLESQIGILTDAVRELTSAMNKHAEQRVFLASGELSPGTVEKFAAAAEELPNAKSEETPQTISSTSEPTESESAPVTYDDVKKVTIAVSKISKDKAVFGLNHFGVQTAKNLVEAQWADYIVFMNEVLEGKRYVD
jgi:hypothetical protein